MRAISNYIRLTTWNVLICSLVTRREKAFDTSWGCFSRCSFLSSLDFRSSPFQRSWKNWKTPSRSLSPGVWSTSAEVVCSTLRGISAFPSDKSHFWLKVRSGSTRPSNDRVEPGSSERLESQYRMANSEQTMAAFAMWRFVLRPMFSRSANPMTSSDPIVYPGLSVQHPGSEPGRVYFISDGSAY